ncbi:hypothetical protein BJ138DRAFT_1145100 [Hygrophoropsis aurantiaca]|uniref:Uncharacterized protein n=1 Tax=Hygrophoropsis aurantiaca TaxID=72124 RepID=A0ACB8ALP1_9AGAM|nr:hypothetical protein BJ138DRAFT_1145100 [Hygrophoropsis aurantiaca]
MSLPIIFYDIASQIPGSAWSPNTWKTRFSLNIKHVAYRTEWIEYCDIEVLALKIGAIPTGVKPDGKPLYTLPIIQDPNTGKVIADSFAIAEYLDETYPNAPTLFPRGTKALFAAFEAGIVNAIGPIVRLQLALSPLLNGPSEKYYRSTREALFGMKIEEMSPIGEKRDEDLAKFKASLASVDEWLAKSNGEYVMNDTVSYADAILNAWLIWIKLVHGADSEVWKNIANWNEGRWAKHLKAMEEFTAIV